MAKKQVFVSTASCDANCGNRVPYRFARNIQCAVWEPKGIRCLRTTAVLSVLLFLWAVLLRSVKVHMVFRSCLSLTTLNPALARTSMQPDRRPHTTECSHGHRAMRCCIGLCLFCLQVSFWIASSSRMGLFVIAYCRRRPKLRRVRHWLKPRSLVT